MPLVQRAMFIVLGLAFTGVPTIAAEPLSEGQLERLMETASQAPDLPDHDYATNSLQAMLHQSQKLKLSQEQTEKIKTIADQYERTRRDREMAYKRSEMDALKLIHDNRSSLFAIENAVQKADQEHTKLRMAGIKALREARDVLRPEQTVNGSRTMRRASSLKHHIRNGASSTIANRAMLGASLRTDIRVLSALRTRHSGLSQHALRKEVHHASLEDVGRGCGHSGPARTAVIADRVGGQ